VVAFALAAACGGAPQGSVKGPARASEDASIGQAAVDQGGIASLGGSSEGASSATAKGLRAHATDESSRVKFDGMLGEWPPLAPADVRVRGAGSVALRAGVQYDATAIYVAGEVQDGSFVRSERFALDEDHAALVLAFPTGPNAYAAYEVALFAGKSGESEGAVKFGHGPKRGQDVPGAKIIEADAAGGYTFEASIPWAAFPEARSVRAGLRGAVRYYDAEAKGSIATIVATGSGEVGQPASLPLFPLESEQALIDTLLAPKGIDASRPKFELLADLSGDAMRERVAVYDRYFTIVGPGYRGGKQFFFRELPSDVLKLEARELTGDGKDDLVVHKRVDVAGTRRDAFEVWSLLGQDEPVTVFAHEIAIVRGDKKITNAVQVAGKQIEVTVEPPVQWDATTYREPAPHDVEPILLPWGAVRSRTFRFEGTRFAKAKEVAQTPAPGVGEAAPSAAALPREPPTPAVTRGGDLSKQLVEQFRRDRNLGAEPTRVDLQVHVAEDPQPERVVLIGRDLAVFGPGFRGGRQYAFLTLSQFAEPSDIRDVTARDLNGDGAAELVVRGVRRVVPNGVEGGPIAIDSMFIYEVRPAGIVRVFGIETAREQANKRVQGMVQFVPARSGKGFDIDVQAGRATGWNASTYPWPQEAEGSGPVEPLVLPWGGVSGRRYTWNGAAFAP
jgi:hypothetical protein